MATVTSAFQVASKPSLSSGSNQNSSGDKERKNCFESETKKIEKEISMDYARLHVINHGFTSFSGSWAKILASPPKTVRGSSSALDALAALASSEKHFHCFSSSSDEDSESMPPPPPRRKGRMRSASNPEGMEKWDSYYHNATRHHFVIPSSILEKELASARVACLEHEGSTNKPGIGLKEGVESNSPSSVMSPSLCSIQQQRTSPPVTGLTTKVCDKLDPEELLKRARSKLIEDISASDNTDKGVLPLPHSLEKYKEIYNKNGRIGIYTPDERAAIIAKFNTKRAQRVWNKKIRYDCRKNLADRRLRIKGRFVKRCNSKELRLDENGSRSIEPSYDDEDRDESYIPSVSGSGSLATVKEDELDLDEDANMPDVNDTEAGFRPTHSQPYRRVRRYTIT